MYRLQADIALKRYSATIWIPVLVCLAVNACVFILIAANRPTLLRSTQLITNPDARQYLVLGRNILTQGRYSRCEIEPFVPDMLRTPLFPIFAGSLDLLGGPAMVFLATAFLQVLNVILVFTVCNRLFGVRAAFAAALLMASDLMTVSYNFSAMAETPFVTPLLAGFLCSINGMCLISSDRSAIWHFASAGLLIACATLVRPTSLYLGPLISAMLVGVGIFKAKPSAYIRSAAVVLAASLVPVAPWVARNYLVFGLPKLTTVDTTNCVYFLGAGSYQLRYNMSLDAAQERIRREFHLPAYRVIQNHWNSEQSPAEMERALTRVMPRVLTRFPFHVIEASALGIVKATLSHSTEHQAELLGMHWEAAGMQSLLRLDSAAWSRLFGNSPILLASFIWQMLHTGAAVVLGSIGAAIAIRRSEHRTCVVLLLLVTAYLYLTIALFGLEAFYRCRIPVVPFLYILAGAGASYVARLGVVGNRSEALHIS